MQSWFRKLLSALLLLATQVSFAAPEAQPIMQKFIALGTASVSGVYHPVGKAICHQVNDVRLTELIRCIAYSTGGSEYNIQAVLSGELTMGITRTDLAYDAFHGKGDFSARGPAPSLRQVLSLYDEPVTMIVKRAANIVQFEDIVGKRVNIGNRGSSQRGIVRMILEAAKIKNESFAAFRELPTAEMGEAFCKGEIDVLFQALGMPAPFFKKMIEECDGQIFPIPPVVIDEILRRYPSLMRLNIPGGHYQGHDEHVPSFGMKTTVITNANISPETIRRFTKAIITQFEELKASHPAIQSMEVSKMFTDGILIPLHDGVKPDTKEAVRR